LKADLAGYKVPRKIYAISSMQRTANGKIDESLITAFAADRLAEQQQSLSTKPVKQREKQ
jgi:3-oxocholest-4-en-26-oate---CoA ligase